MKRETQIIKAYANHVILTPTPQLIPAGRDPNWSSLIRPEKPNRSLQRSNLNYLSFQNPQILRTISSGYDVLNPLNSLQRPPSLISCLGVDYNRWWLSYPFCAGVKVHHLTNGTWTKRHRVIQSLIKYNQRKLIILKISLS